ncbi:DUF2218 domain-containing protein [Streptomyces umbrinus]|uniref:DUF2218 domain-containing protein n=1 Tax=Streptomyces umbrinus TaxID=67370 RepID=UPI001672A65A|nr:DUF2218 domain-containing protein [Streptomyces umbrinus]
MPTAEARVETDRASRYLVQLCRHAQQMGRHTHYRPRAHGGGDTHRPPEVHDVEWSNTRGTVRLSLGQWTLEATPEALVLRAEAATEENLLRMQDLIAGRLEKIGRRDHLAADWQRIEGSPADPDAGGRTEGLPSQQKPGHTGSTSRRWTLKAVVGAVGLMVLAHLVLGGSVLAASRWLGWGAGALALAVVIVKAIGMGGLALRHRQRRVR